MRKVFSSLLIVSVLIIGIGCVSCLLFFQMNASMQNLTHTQQVLYAQSEVYSRLQDMNLASRGYAMTGKNNTLEPYNDGISRLAANEEMLKSLTANDSSEQPLVHKLIDHASQFGVITKSLINTKDAELIQSQKRLMDEVRSDLNAIVQIEKQHFAFQTSQAEMYYFIGWTALALELMAGLGLLLASWNSIKSYSAENASQVEVLRTEIEQRKQIESELKQTAFRLTSSNNDLQQFAYAASHDLQEPLRAVVGFLTLLQKKQENNLDADSKTYIKHAVEGAMRMRALVNDLLAYSRLESRAKEFENVELNDVIYQAKKNLSQSIAESAAQINSDELPTVFGDPIQLESLFQNLISNAIKFRSEEPPIVSITARRSANRWIISVSDNGRGFDMEYSKRIFVIFQRLQGRTEAAGTGIGLAICKKVVERHQGTIEAFSEPGKGATFSFDLSAAIETSKPNT